MDKELIEFLSKCNTPDDKNYLQMIPWYLITLMPSN
jgi:hypothetical protein